MANLKIEANYRSDMRKSRAKAIRREGYVTGSVFGRDAEPMAVEVGLADLVHKIKGSEAGMMSLIDMKIKDAPKKSDGPVIIKTFFKDPLTRKVLDIQFQRISMKEKLHMAVPVIGTGEARGIKEGGILEQLLEQMEVSCLPGDLPSRFEVDVSELSVGDHIRVADIAVPEGVEVLADAEALVFTCVPPHVRAEAEGEEAGEAAAEQAPTEESAQE